MKRLTSILLGLGLIVAPLTGNVPASPGAQAAGAVLRVNLAQAGPRISPTMFGLMFEDINHAGDGGLYGELIANRNLQSDPLSLDDWLLVHGSHSHGSLDLDATKPVNLTALPLSLRLTISHVHAGERVGAANDGFYGIPVRPATRYRASVYARASAAFRGPLTLDLESASGRRFASAQIPALTTAWRQYTVTLITPAGITPSANNLFVLSASHTGTVWLSLVSLFPPTWNNRPNGLRVDLMRDLAALHPGFLRFPGGNFLEGQTIDTRFNWKQTIGPLSLRPGHQDDAWGYYSSDGLGLLEYLEWCEDLHMVPVLAVYAGYSLGGAYVPAGPGLRPYVQDALDEIQYAIGPITTPWGARRAADGHPAPFAVPYVEVGNEDFFDRSGSYDGRFAQFYDAIRKAYPAIKIIATAPVTSRVPDVYDQHFYNSPQWFAAHPGYYDNYSRSAPKIMVGEYAAQNGPIGQGTATLGTALGEAAWMTGLERNADVVIMASYAPLFQNVQGSNWAPDLISFDALSSYGSPSYYVQQLFSRNHGDEVAPSTITGGGLTVVASKDSRRGLLYITVVNGDPAARMAQIVISGATSLVPTGTAMVLTAPSLDDQNSLAAPARVSPQTRAVSGLGLSFSYRFLPRSVTVLRLTARRSLVSR